MKLFTKVHCKGYLKKTSDGVYIRILNKFGILPQIQLRRNTARELNVRSTDSW